LIFAVEFKIGGELNLVALPFELKSDSGMKESLEFTVKSLKSEKLSPMLIREDSRQITVFG
jgi:hypothetical protein